MENDVETTDSDAEELGPTVYWSETGVWPKEYFEPDKETRKYLMR